MRADKRLRKAGIFWKDSNMKITREDAMMFEEIFKEMLKVRFKRG